jgi:hypothetical protein
MERGTVSCDGHAKISADVAKKFDVESLFEFFQYHVCFFVEFRNEKEIVNVDDVDDEAILKLLHKDTWFVLTLLEF